MSHDQVGVLLIKPVVDHRFLLSHHSRTCRLSTTALSPTRECLGDRLSYLLVVLNAEVHCIAAMSMVVASMQNQKRQPHDSILLSVLLSNVYYCPMCTRTFWPSGGKQYELLVRASKWVKERCDEYDSNFQAAAEDLSNLRQRVQQLAW